MFFILADGSPLSSLAPTTSGAGLSSAEVAYLTALGISALLFVFLCVLLIIFSLRLAVTIAKTRRTLAETPSITTDQQVKIPSLTMHGNEAYMSTSQIAETSITNTESNPAYGPMRIQGNEAYMSTSQIAEASMTNMESNPAYGPMRIQGNEAYMSTS